MPVTSFRRRLRVGVSASSSGFIGGYAGLAACANLPGAAANSERQSGFIIPEIGAGKTKTEPPGNRFRDSPNSGAGEHRQQKHWVPHSSRTLLEWANDGPRRAEAKWNDLLFRSRSNYGLGAGRGLLSWSRQMPFRRMRRWRTFSLYAAWLPGLV